MKIRLTTDDELQTQEKNQAGNIAILERQIAMLRDRLDLALLANHMAANVPSDQQPDEVGACYRCQQLISYNFSFSGLHRQASGE